MISLMDSALIVAVIASTLRGTAPILLAALGETYVERAGLLNLGIEGMMVAGAFSSFLVGLKMDNLMLGFLTAGLVGIFFGLVFGLMTITLKVNQIVVGLGLTIFLHSGCSFLHRVIFGNQFPMLFGAGGTNEIPFLSKIPLIGQPVFNQHWLLYVAFLMIPVLYFIMYKTSLGLRVRSVGETPWAADAGVRAKQIERILQEDFGAQIETQITAEEMQKVEGQKKEIACSFLAVWKKQRRLMKKESLFCGGFFPMEFLNCPHYFFQQGLA